jgi:superfamily II RNA helicase
MREFQLLPAIVFLKSRADCDKALKLLRPHPEPEHEDGFLVAIKKVTELYPELRSRPQMDYLITRRAASHHAGQLPAWRLMVEKMMTLGHLDVIFSTSTVAAGVNFPARTVVVTQSDRFDGKSFVDMTATDLHQMTGRAGRRGMDKVGFTLILPGKFLDVELIKRLVLSSPEPLRSRITINFSMTLNLLLSHSPIEVRELLGRSFAAFHPNPARARKAQRKLQKEFQKHLNLLEELDYLDEKGAPTYDGRWAAKLRLDHPLLIAELIRHGAFDDLPPDQLAALIAPFVIDKDKQVFMSRVTWDFTRPLWKQFRKMIRRLKPLAAFLVARGFDVPPILFWPAATAFTWAQDIDWDYLAEHVGADEGDMAMLILRTIDHLRQLVSLKEEKPQLADTAAEAIDMLARSPLI